MRPFSYARATDAEAAIALVQERADGTFVAGGTTEVDLVRQNVLRPGLLVDINDLPLGGIEDLPGGGLRIGALARMSDVARGARRERAIPCHLAGAGAGRVGATAEHGLDGRQPVPAGAVQLFP
jgi:CO/xanthine dehydrogenase FAD-binding subunit